MKWWFWGVVRFCGRMTLALGEKLYWAGKQGQRRHSKRNKLL